MKKKVFRSTSIFKCIVEFKNGTHKILRITSEMVAKITTLFRDCKRSIFHEEILLFVGGDYLSISQIARCKFIYENSHKELLTLE